MEITGELIRKIQSDHPSTKNDPDALAKVLRKIESTKKQIMSIERRRIDSRKEHEARLKALAQEEKEVRDDCGHESHTYYPDASGNNDSCNRCDFCGREW